MNSEWAEPPKEQASSLATPGAQLAAQREAMGWSVEQIADQLKLAPRQVVALEQGDYAALPNMAVVRGFVRAYAKVVKLDATPLVAMIAVGTPASHEPPPRREMAATTFSESRFPTLTERSSKSNGWMIVAAVVVVVAAAGGYAYKTGMISPAMFHGADKEAAAAAAAPADKPADASAPIETTLVKPGADNPPLQTASVPLISVPGPSDAPANAPSNAAANAPAAVTSPAPAAAANVPAPATAAVAPPAPAAATPAPAAAGTGNALVLKVNEDSWIEIRHPGKAPLIARLVKAGSTETFDIKDPSLLIVGKPNGVEATLGGTPLSLPPIAGGTISRVNIK